MDTSAARGYIELRLQPFAAPALTEAEFDSLVMGASSDDGDTYTVSACLRAIYDGFAVKHAKYLADGFKFSTDGQSFERQQVLEHLVQQRRFYRAQLVNPDIDGALPYGVPYASSE